MPCSCIVCAVGQPLVPRDPLGVHEQNIYPGRCGVLGVFNRRGCGACLWKLSHRVDSTPQTLHAW